MNREIEFRAKDYEGNWQYGSYYHGFMYPETFMCHYIDDILIYENTLGQYTGLKDKNGAKIYEGDILKSDYGSGKPTQICFGEYKDYSDTDADLTTALGFYWLESDAITSRFGKSITGNMDYCEVIGNIYENPELLK